MYKISQNLFQVPRPVSGVPNRAGIWQNLRQYLPSACQISKWLDYLTWKFPNLMRFCKHVFFFKMSYWILSRTPVNDVADMDSLWRCQTTIPWILGTQHCETVKIQETKWSNTEMEGNWRIFVITGSTESLWCSQCQQIRQRDDLSISLNSATESNTRNVIRYIDCIPNDCGLELWKACRSKARQWLFGSPAIYSIMSCLCSEMKREMGGLGCTLVLLKCSELCDFMY